jgi:hypothetical protein
MKSVLSAAMNRLPVEEEVSLESQFFDEMDDHTELTLALEEMDRHTLRLEEMDEVMNGLESLQSSLESLIETNQYGGVTATLIQEQFVSLERRADVEYEAPSFEGILEGGLAEAELTLEAVTGIWNRLKQAYVSVWHGFMDGMSSLIKGVDKFSAKHVQLAQKLKKEWDIKKTKISGKAIKSSLAGSSVITAFTYNSQLVKSPTLALKTDLAHAKYMLEDYIPTMSKYLSQVESIVQRGDYTSDAGFEKSVLRNMSSLPHPRALFKSTIVDKGSVLLMNRGLVTKPGKPVKPVAPGREYQALANLLVKKHVRQYVNLKFLFNVELAHDVFFELRDIDAMLSMYESMASLLEGTSGRLSMAMKAAKNITELNTEKLAGDNLSGTNKSAVKQIGKFIKQLPVYLNRPTKKEINRVSAVISGTRTLLSRTIATAK